MQSDHEYESAAEDSAQEESEVLDLPTDDEQKNHKAGADDQDAEDGDNEEDVDDPDDDDDDVSDPDNVLTEEREAGDGQEENKKVDDDEDRRNPQYIPKKGMFYEHDDRIDSEEEAAKAEEEAKALEAKPARVPRSENVERWGHDKFLEREQQPKTREELVNAYGYDIRNEDSAPRARRRRRYGRGPNKYTRKWDDEKAYEPRNGGGGPKSEVTSKSGPRGGAEKREFRDSNEKLSSTAPRKSDLEEFPPLEHKNNRANSKQTDNSSNSKSVRGGAASSRGRGGGRGGGSSRGRNGPAGGDRPQTQPSSIDSKKQRAPPGGGKSEYSANQRLQKEPKPIVQNAHQSNRSQESGGKMDKLEKDFNSKAKLDDNKKRGGAKDSPRTSRRTQDSEDNSKPKRYSNSRRGGNSRGQHQQDYYDYNDQQEPQQQTQHKQQQQPQQRYMNGNGNSSGGVPSNFVNNFPNSGSGPPPAAPFIAANTVASAPPTSTSGFQDPAMIVNYGPPVQFAPVAVPVTVTVPLVSVPGGAPAGTPHDSLAVLHPSTLGTPTVTSPDQVLLAAAAAGAGQGYAEVRGGVTYFNPTAQAPVMARPVNKRPKAAIPIVDPSQVGAISPGASDSLEESLEGSSSSVMVAKT